MQRPIFLKWELEKDFNMKHLQKALINLVLVVVMAGCSKDHLFDCLKGSGKEITVERSVAPFNYIKMFDKVDLVYFRGYKPYVRIVGGSNLINGISTEVQDSILTLRNENTCNWVRDFNKRIRVEIFTDSITRIDNEGSGNITFHDTLRCYDFRYDNISATGHLDLLMDIEHFYCNIHTGTVSIVAAGKARFNIFYYHGYGSMNLRGLATETTYISNKGSNDIFTSVENELFARVESQGNIYYLGNPHTIETVILGSGKVIKE